eukprot:4054410-Ditylum_brightwellii.AAC.1
MAFSAPVKHLSAAAADCGDDTFDISLLRMGDILQQEALSAVDQLVAENNVSGKKAMSVGITRGKNGQRVKAAATRYIVKGQGRQ